jgi:hypothetical protein
MSTIAGAGAADKATGQLKEDAEELAKITVENRVSVGQIKSLHDRAKSRVRDDFEVYLKYQMSRPSDNTRHKNIISEEFGNRLLSFLSKYQKQDLVKLLRYTVMLYKYTKQSKVTHRPSSS